MAAMRALVIRTSCCSSFSSVSALTGRIRFKESAMNITRRQFMTVAAAGIAHAAKGPLKVITSTEDMASLTREVGGDHVAVESLARGYQDPHFVEPKPSFIAKVHSADLLIAVGLQLEI